MMSDKDALAFAERLRIACDDHPSCPPLHAGRQTWIRDRMLERGIEVTTQSVHRWCKGHIRPYHRNILILAEILRVNPGWLSTGSREDKTEKIQRKLAIAENGALSLLSGMLQSKGFSVAVPDEDDVMARNEGVQTMAIIRGRKHSFHAAMCEDLDDGELSVRFPVDPVGKTTLVAVFVDEDFVSEAFELNGEWVRENFTRTQGSYIVNFNTNEDNPAVKRFGEFIRSAMN